MKKLISAVLVVVMVLCALSLSVSAAGTLYFSADFSSDEAFSKDFYPEGFSIDEGEAFGYSDAKALQTKGVWQSYDTTFTFCVEEDDAVFANEGRSLSFVYLNQNLLRNGLAEGALSMSVFFDIHNDEITLIANQFTRGDDTVDLAPTVEFDFKDGEYYNFGVSITKGRIRVFHDDSIIIDFVDSENKYYIGYEYEDVEASVLVWWNTGNYIRFSDIKVSSPEYLYPATPVQDDVTTSETTTSEKIVTVTDDKGNAVTDDKGQTITSVSIVTEAPTPAQTNQNKPAGGSSSSTGDVTFVVVAAMVATLGCALIVKKVSAR